MYDLLLEGGETVDGTGAPRHRADVGISGERIEAVGHLSGSQAKQRIHCAGRTIVPGFVDLHSHHDLVLSLPPPLQARYLEGRLLQGITTEIVGNCGLGAFPVTRDSTPLVAALDRFISPPEAAFEWGSPPEYLARLERQGVALNVGALLPHGPLRVSTMGMTSRAPTGPERAAMRRGVREACDAGAFGISFGLIYPPGQYASTEEVDDLCSALHSGAFAAFHQRSGSAELIERSIEEILDVGRRTGRAVHLSHDHAQGERAWPLIDSLLALGDRARAGGLDYTQDVIPYTGVNTTMLALYPGWALAEGVEGFLRLARDPAARGRMKEEMASKVPSWPPWVEGNWCTNLVRDSGWESVHVAHAASARPVAGRGALDLARSTGKDPFDAITDLLLDSRGDVTMLLFGISGDREQDGPLRALLAHPTRAIVSDAWECGQAAPHPGAYGAFPRLLARYVRETRTLAFEEAVRKATSLPADRLGLRGRGRIEPGAYADLVVLDPESVADASTYERPRAPARGIDRVFVNGVPAVERGRYLPGTPGRVLRRD
ncbi:MAG: N-acyl-D-amino-acid deacylase family protein [Planctomycetota bacterium]